jgi:hypothetical protein
MSRKKKVLALLTAHPPQPKEGGPHGEGPLSGGGARQKMSTKSHKKSSASSTLAIVVASESSLNAGPNRSEAELKKEFEALCKEAKGIQRETEKFAALIQRNFLKLGQTLYRAKVVYETLTGTGHGKRRKIEGLLSFDEEVANRTGVSRALVQKYSQIGKLLPETANLIEGKKLAGNLTALVRIAQAEGIASLAELAAAVDAFEDGGRKEMDAVLDKAAPKQIKANNATTQVEQPPPQEVVPSSTPEVLDAEDETDDVNEDAAETVGADEDGLDVDGDESHDDESKDGDDLDAHVVTVEPVGTAPQPLSAASSVEVPSEPITEVVEVPVSGQTGKGVLFGADLVVEVVRATGRQFGFVVRITATKPGASLATMLAGTATAAE